MTITIDADEIPAVIKQLEKQDQESAPEEYFVSDGVYMRRPTDTTIGDVQEDWRSRTHWANAHVDKIAVALDVDEEQGDRRTISFNDHEVPATDRGLESLARFLKMPVSYMLKVPGDEQQFMFDKRLERHGDERAAIEYTSDGILSMAKSGKAIVDPAELADALSEYFPEDALVRDAWVSQADLRLDVLFPKGHQKTTRAHGEGHILGGIRLSQNRKQNLAPVVRPILYWTGQTNILEIDDPTLRVDARKKDEFEIIAEVRLKVQEAIERLERDIAALVRLGEHRIGADPTGSLRRVAMDGGLSERATMALLGRIGVISDEPTMLDFANLIANQANVMPRTNAARTLQQAAGDLANDHTARCKACHHRLV